MSRIRRLRELSAGSVWVFPAVLVTLAIGGGFAVVDLDRSLDTRLGFDGGADGARNVLSTIAAAMITFTGLVFSITIVALQLASGQFSPRVMRTFLRDRMSKLALGTFVATFTFAFVVLRAVRDDFVPGISVNLSILLVLLSVAVFIGYIDHIAKAIRVSSVINAVAEETRETLDRVCPLEAADAPPHEDLGERSAVILNERAPGVITSFSREKLVRQAADAGVALRLEHGVGAFVAHGAPLLSVYGPADGIDSKNTQRCVALDSERTMEQDLAFGLRQLGDLAARALSPGVNDPTTAVQAIDQIHDLLRRIGTREIPPGRVADDSGTLRLVHPSMDWSDYVALGIDEARLYGGEQMQVQRRLRALIEDVRSVVAPERHGPLDEQVRLLDEAAARGFDDERDRRRAGDADAQGIGS